MTDLAASPHISPDPLARALGRWFDELDEILQAEGLEPERAHEPPSPVYGEPAAQLPLPNSRSIAAAVYDSRGHLLAATDAFRTAGCEARVDAERLAEATVPEARPVWLPAERSADDPEATTLVIYAPARLTTQWRLPDELREAMRSSPRAVVVLTTVLHTGTLKDACVAYGLGGLQTRVALETVRLGGIKPAAQRLGLSHQTAREALSEAMKRVGARRLPDLVTRLTTLALGVFPGQPLTGDVLADAWGMSERQIAIAGMLTEGASRAQAARTLGLSLSLVKKELDVIYALLQVSSAGGLAYKLVEARALSWLTAATTGGLGFADDQSEPLRFVLRADGGRIAVSDYGPASGRPVLILHSSMTTRIVARKLLRALHAEGYRPIAIDRPGFGLSDRLTGVDDGADPFTAATPDVLCVLDALKIRRVDIISRGAAQFLIALAEALPDRLAQVVLVNPGPPYRYSGRSIGPLGLVKNALIANPAAARALAPFLAGQLTFRRLSRMLTQWTRGSRPDQRAVENPEFVVDFFRSVRMFATGRYEGFIREQSAIARGGKPAPFVGAAGWRVLVADNDVLYDPAVVFAYWRELLPGASIQTAPDTGRFLAMTHPHLIVRALTQ